MRTKKVINIFLGIILIQTFNFCKLEKENKVNIPVINLITKNEKSLLMKDYFSEITYIPLESKKECMIAGFPSYYLTDKYIVAISNNILLFDRYSGKFIKEVSRKGNGPDEYVTLTYIGTTFEKHNSALVNQGRNWLEINFDTNESIKIEIPDSKDLNRFDHPKEIDGLANAMEPMFPIIKIDSNLYAGYVHNRDGHTDVNMAFFDKTGKIQVKTKNYLSFEPEMDEMRQYEPNFYSFQNNLYFKEYYNDTIFEVKNRQITPHAVFQLGKKAPSYKTQQTNPTHPAIHISSICETPIAYIFNFIDDKRYTGIYNKETNSIYVSLKGIVNNIDNGPSFQSIKTNTFGEYFSIIPAETIIASEIHNTEQLKKVVEDDNPVIAILKSKK